jgi:hypothetical protein
VRFGVDVGRMSCSEGGRRGGDMLKKWGTEKSLTESVGGYLCNWDFICNFAGDKQNPFVTQK